jgi:hypothetical protein
MVCCGTVVEDVLAVMGDEKSARLAARNPHIDPSISDQDASHRLADAAHKELVFS